jgi:hypothetical protein
MLVDDLRAFRHVGADAFALVHKNNATNDLRRKKSRLVPGDKNR